MKIIEEGRKISDIRSQKQKAVRNIAPYLLIELTAKRYLVFLLRVLLVFVVKKYNKKEFNHEEKKEDRSKKI